MCFGLGWHLYLGSYPAALVSRLIDPDSWHTCPDVSVPRS
jgi:hypothetical protein